ncbi:hypothetical protein ACNKHM_08375 [Shigella sonnei]
MRIKITIGRYFNNGAALLIVLKEHCFVPTRSAKRYYRYACNFFAVNGGVVILK